MQSTLTPKKSPVRVSLTTVVAVAAMALLNLTGCMVEISGEVTNDDGVELGDDAVIVTEIRDLKSFSQVAIQENVNVTVVAGHTYSAQVTADGDIVADCQTHVHNGTLEVGWAYAYQVGNAAEVILTTPDLTSFIQNGDGNVQIDAGSTLRDFRIELNGSGNITFHGHVDRLTAVVNGSGELELVGDALALQARVNGSGALYADPLTAADVQAVMAGSGDMTLALDNGAWLDLTVSGSGQTEWWGNPGNLKYRLTGNGAVIEHRGLLKAGVHPRLPRKTASPR